MGSCRRENQTWVRPPSTTSSVPVLSGPARNRAARPGSTAPAAIVEFVPDSPLEEAGFEPSIPQFRAT
jgi:hypothetical protein